MKLWEALRGARGLEWILLVAMAGVLACFLIGGEAGEEGLEARTQRALSMVEGAGEVRVAIYENETGVVGALIVSEGAGDARVMLTLRMAAHTLLGVENERIEVVKMEGQK